MGRQTGISKEKGSRLLRLAECGRWPLERGQSVAKTRDIMQATRPKELLLSFLSRKRDVLELSLSESVLPIACSNIARLP